MTDDNAGQRTGLVRCPAFIIHAQTQTGLFVIFQKITAVFLSPQ